jgi:hypothetical protein
VFNLAFWAVIGLVDWGLTKTEGARASRWFTADSITVGNSVQSGGSKYLLILKEWY